MKNTLFFLILLLLPLGIIAQQTTTSSWGWKRATGIEDAIKFLNAEGAYKNPIKEACVVVNKDSKPLEFIIFYQTGNYPVAGKWAWKLATTEDDVHNFLNGKGSYKKPVKAAKIATLVKSTYTEFYVFYKR